MLRKSRRMRFWLFVCLKARVWRTSYVASSSLSTSSYRLSYRKILFSSGTRFSAWRCVLCGGAQMPRRRAMVNILYIVTRVRAFTLLCKANRPRRNAMTEEWWIKGSEMGFYLSVCAWKLSKEMRWDYIYVVVNNVLNIIQYIYTHF